MQMPEEIPSFSVGDLERLAPMSYTELAFEILSLFIDESEIPREDLREIINKSFEAFPKDVIPIVPVGGVHVAELFHGTCCHIDC